MNTKLIDGKQYEVKEIVGYGTCLVPVKTGIELFREWVSNNGEGSIFNKTDRVNSAFEFALRGGNTLKMLEIQSTHMRFMGVGLLFSYQNINDACENYFSFGFHDNWESFLTALETECIVVTPKTNAKK